MPTPGVAEKRIGMEWELTGKQYLRMPESVGLPLSAQDKLVECVVGRLSFEGRGKKQKTWKSIGEFLNDMREPLKRTPIALSEEAWFAIANHFGRPTGPMAKKIGEVV